MTRLKYVNAVLDNNKSGVWVYLYTEKEDLSCNALIWSLCRYWKILCREWQLQAVWRPLIFQYQLPNPTNQTSYFCYYIVCYLCLTSNLGKVQGLLSVQFLLSYCFSLEFASPANFIIGEKPVIFHGMIMVQSSIYSWLHCRTFSFFFFCLLLCKVSLFFHVTAASDCRFNWTTVKFLVT